MKRMTAEPAIRQQMAKLRAARKQDVAKIEQHYQKQMEEFARAFGDLAGKTEEVNGTFVKNIGMVRASHHEAMMRLRDYAGSLRDMDLVREIETSVSSVGDDAQLANVDMQNWLQKQQQVLQSMSNISKMLHDTAMAIIRKIGS